MEKNIYTKKIFKIFSQSALKKLTRAVDRKQNNFHGLGLAMKRTRACSVMVYV